MVGPKKMLFSSVVGVRSAMYCLLPPQVSSLGAVPKLPLSCSPTLSRSLLSQSSPRILDHRRILFLSNFCACAQVVIFFIFISHSFPMSGPFQSIPHEFFSLNCPSLQPPLSCGPFFSYPRSSLSRFFLTSCFLKSTFSPVVSLFVQQTR